VGAHGIRTLLSIKELRRKLKVSDRYEFKFNKTDRKFKNLFFRTTGVFKFRVRAIVVDKKTIFSSRLRGFKENFYNYSRQNTLIQLADMVAGAAFSASTGKDESYLEGLRKAGRIEDIWSFK